MGSNAATNPFSVLAPGAFSTSGNSSAVGIQQQTAAQNADTTNLVNQIKGAYSSPDMTQTYNNYDTDLTNYYTNQVGQQQQVAARNLLFANARSGLTGGSAAADNNTQLQKDYSQGLVSAANTAQDATNSLINSNTQQEDALISQAAGGGTVGGVNGLMSQAQAGNLNQAKSSFEANQLNNAFGDVAQDYTNEQNQAALAKMMQNPYGGLYGGNQQSIYGGVT